MTTSARLAAFGLAALVAFGGGAAIGAAVGPDPAADAPAHSVPAADDGHTDGAEKHP